MIFNKFKNGVIFNENCIGPNGMCQIPDKSIDMILCDLPYGVTARNKWDIIIPFEPLWEEYKRIIKDNGTIVLTATQPFASMLITSNIEMFKYEWIWEKPYGQGFLNAKKQPLRNHEQVLVFYDSQPNYNPQFTSGKPYICKQGGHGTNYGERGKDVEEVVTINDGKRYPLTVQKIKYDTKKIHPNQKPIFLFEYLIKTYTNENNMILDNCAGSGTTGIACMNLNRKFILYEWNDKGNEYYEVAVKRLQEHENSMIGGNNV